MVVTLRAFDARQNHSAGALESCNNADNWAALRFIWRVAKNQHCGVQRAVPQPRLLKVNEKRPPTEAG